MSLVNPIPETNLKLGVILAIVSNLLFSVFFLYSGWLAPMTGTQVFVWRLLTMFVVILAYLMISGQLNIVLDDLKQIHHKKSWLAFLLPTPIMLSQLWLFVWSPINGHGVAVATGYFLFPLAMVLAGCVIFKESLIGLQKLAVAFAVLGVGLELFWGGSLSWATFWVCGTYPIYYIMRRRLGVRAITGLFADTLFFVPFGIGYLLVFSDFAYQTLTSFMIIKAFGLGFLSVLAFMANLQAVRLLPVSLFGMLSYLEPLLLFILAITVLGEPITAKMAISYGLIALGIGCLILHGVMNKKA